MIEPCAIVPVYNHAQFLPRTLAAIRQTKLPIVLVDDGSSEDNAQAIARIAAAISDVQLIVRSDNGGKGAAVMDGMREARRLGYTHALQIDADGQHNIDDVPRFLAAVRRQPTALIAGVPQFDRSIPKARYYSRYLTHVWVWINTLSFDIKDSMCGFRIYPLAASVDLISSARLGKRMDFDPEFLVRWHWRGLPIVQLETRVVYPDDGVSHFQPWQDNVLISWMHTRLFFGMLLRLPLLLRKRLSA